MNTRQLVQIERLRELDDINLAAAVQLRKERDEARKERDSFEIDNRKLIRDNTALLEENNKLKREVLKP